MRAHPERYTRPQNDARTTGVARPVWFDLLVEDTRTMSEVEAEQYVAAFLSQLHGTAR